MKYIIFDLDDTLLPRDKEISKFTIDTFKKYQEKGNKIVINTARGKNATTDYSRILNCDYSICNGGSLILNNKEETIYSAPMNLDNVNAMIKELMPLVEIEGLSFECDKGMYAWHPEKVNMQKAELFDFHNEIKDLDIYKVIICSSKFAEVEAIANKYGFSYTNYLGGTWGRINLDGIDKWSGVEHLLEVTNGKVEDTIAFGDDSGDIAMLQGAHIGVAMGNSKQIVLDTIKIKCGNCEDDGVAHYLLDNIEL